MYMSCSVLSKDTFGFHPVAWISLRLLPYRVRASPGRNRLLWMMTRIGRELKLVSSFTICLTCVLRPEPTLYASPGRPFSSSNS